MLSSPAARAAPLAEGPECSLSSLADGSALGAVAVLEGRDALHRDIQKPPGADQSQIQGREDVKYNLEEKGGG